jgi:hypothetical protein
MVTEAYFSGGRVSNTWATCLEEGDNIEKSVLIPHNIQTSPDDCIKGEIRFEMGPRLIS